MGLDITAYRRITKLNIPADSEDFYDIGGFRAYRDDENFPGRADDVEDKAAYTAVESFHFGADTYSAYYRWRENLARLAGWPLSSFEIYGNTQPSYAASAWAATSGPFWEMILFTDCAGFIGAAVSAKLAKDFSEYQPIIDKAPDWPEAGRFRECYANFRKAFEMGADGGAVQFH